MKSPKQIDQTELDNARTKIKSLEQELESKTRDFESRISSQRRELQSEISKKTRDIERISSQNRELQSEISKKTRDIERISSQNRELQSEIERRTKDFESRLAKVEKEKEDLEKRLQEKQKSESTSGPSAQQPLFTKINIIDSESIDEYESVEDIGVGSSGRVVKVAKKAFYAMKIMNITNASTESFRHFLSEYEIMNMLNHPNILKALEMFLSDSKKPPAIILEFCPHNLVFAITTKLLTNVEIASAIYQIAEGMRYVHFNKIIHRDLKPSNILIAVDGTIKISDFGISKLMTPEQFSMTIGVGTNKFMAPEIIAEEDDYNEKVDVYSFGVLVYYMLSGGQFPKIKTPQILQGKKAEIPSSFTELAKTLIYDCWNFEAKDRPSFSEICERMIAEGSNIVQTTKEEKKEFNLFVKNHQKRIPKY